MRDLAESIAVEAGEALARALHDPRIVDTKSTGTDMVTEMDRASEALIVSRLIAARPDDAIIGEEGADRSGTSGLTWHIDPLDGTTNYLYRLPGWNVSVGAEFDGEPIVGAVVVPASHDVYVGASGLGATVNGRPMTLGDPAPLADCLVGTGFAYDPAVRRRQAANLVEILPAIRDIRRVGAAAGDLCAVADSRLDAYFESGLSSWDRCAGTAIARAAGRRVEHFTDHPLPGLLTVAAHPERWDELCTLLRSVGVLPAE